MNQMHETKSRARSSYSSFQYEQSTIEPIIVVIWVVLVPKITVFVNTIPITVPGTDRSAFIGTLSNSDS